MSWPLTKNAKLKTAYDKEVHMEDENIVPDASQDIINDTDFLKAEETAKLDFEAIEETTPQIAGFWRRLFAFILDLLIFIILLQIVGWLFQDFAFSLGPWGRLIGFGLLIPYWGYFNSEKGLGQTIGKQVMKIAVVDQDNQYLSFGQSMLRAFLFGAVGLFNRWQLPILENPVFAAIIIVIVFGGGLSLFYGLLFNRTTRQGVHDLIVGSYVIMAPPAAGATIEATPYKHKRNTWGLVGVGVLLAALSLFWQGSPPSFGLLQEGEWDEIRELQAALMQNDEFFSASVTRVNRSSSRNATVLKDLNIEVWAKSSCEKQPDHCETLVNDIAKQAFATYASIDELSGMRIAVVNGFDFGFTSRRNARGAAFSMSDWQQRLQENAAD